MAYKKIEKLKEGEGRTYEVRLNLGDNYVIPPKFMKHWWNINLSLYLELLGE